MPTAPAIVNRAAEIIGYKDPDETLGSADSTNFLGVLNSMVDGWALNRLFVHAVSEIAQTVSGNPIAIGPSATIDTPRPIRIPSGGFFRSGEVDYGFEMVTREQYDAFAQKATDSPYPRYCYYEALLPTGNLYFYPALSGSGELHLPVEQRLAQFADLTTDYTLAPGFRAALEYSLAEALTPGRRTMDPQVQRLAALKRAAVETFDPPMLTTGFERSGGNILAGWES